jgi:large subunit ribosomal protein L3
MKVSGTKLKMSQVWKENECIAVTPVKVSENSDLSEIKEGELVKVSGTTKGRGFQGVVKRHGFHGGPKSHGQKDRLRAPGSNGPTAPQRTIKGRRMAGHMGVERVTIKNLEVIDIQTEEKIVLMKGAIPGPVGGKIEIQK